MSALHYLGIARHFVAYAFQPYVWVPNISAAIIQFVLVVVVLKVLRRRVEAWARRLTRKFIAPHLQAHLEAVKEHVSEEIAKLR